MGIRYFLFIAFELRVKWTNKAERLQEAVYDAAYLYAETVGEKVETCVTMLK